MNIARSKEEHYIIRGLIHCKDITILSMYAHNNRDTKYMKQNQVELKGEIDKFIFLPGDFSTPFTIIDRISGQIINKCMEDLTALLPNFT